MEELALDVKVMNIHRLPDGGHVKAFVDLGINDAIMIKGIRVVDGKKGLFVSMPSELGKDEKWYEKVRCMNKNIEKTITGKVLEAYQITSHDL